MSTIDVNNTIMNMQTDTSIAEASATKAGVKKMDADMFLKLMLEQLKYQDPMDPVDNKEFLAQQAQFTQVSETQEMNASITKNNNVMQTLALVGKDVVMVDPADAKKTISGTVTAASFDSKESAITVNGKEYPLSLVTKVQSAGTTSVAKPAATT